MAPSRRILIGAAIAAVVIGATLVGFQLVRRSSPDHGDAGKDKQTAQQQPQQLQQTAQEQQAQQPAPTARKSAKPASVPLSPPRKPNTGATATGNGSGSAAAPRRQSDAGQDAPSQQPSTTSRSLMKLLSNEQLVHRLMVDPSFRMPDLVPDTLLDWSVPLPDVAAGEGSDAVAAASAAATTDWSLFAFPDTSIRAARRTVRFWQLVVNGARPSDAANALVAGVQAIMAGIAELIPSRQDLHSQLAADVDLRLLHQMITHNAIDADSLERLVQVLAQYVLKLEAPASAAASNAWLQQVQTSLSSAATADAWRQIVPRVMAWFFFKLDEIRVGVANFHLGMLVPYLHESDRGVLYERDRFQAALRDQKVELQDAKKWLSFALDKLVAVAGGDKTALRSVVRRWERPITMSIAVEGLLILVVRESSLARDATVAAVASTSRLALQNYTGQTVAVDTPQELWFPETLRLDAPALRTVQEVLQRVALNATLSSVIRSTLEGVGIPVYQQRNTTGTLRDGVTCMEELYTALDIHLGDESLTREHLRQAVLDAAKNLATTAHREIPAESSSIISAAIDSAISTTHPLFALYFKRAVAVLRERLYANSELRNSSVAAFLPAVAMTAGMDPWLGQLHAIADMADRITQHNFRVYQPFYHQICVELL